MDDESEVIARKPVCDELCRLCANTDKQLIPIFQGEGVEHNLSDQIKKYLPIIKVTEIDKLPLQVCYQCTSTLIAWHNFFEQCRVADSRLREILPSSEKFNQDDDPYHDYTDDFRDDSESQSPVIEKKDEASVTVSIIDSSQRMETNDIVSSIKSKEDDKSESETLCENRCVARAGRKRVPLTTKRRLSPSVKEERAKIVKSKKIRLLDSAAAATSITVAKCRPLLPKVDPKVTAVVIPIPTITILNVNEPTNAQIESKSSGQLLTLPAVSAKNQTLPRTRSRMYLLNTGSQEADTSTAAAGIPAPAETTTAAKVNVGGSRKRVLNCNKCSFTTTSKQTLERHLLLTHSAAACAASTADEEPYSCYHCDYNCKRKFDIKRHITNVHLARQESHGQQLTCGICWRTFVKKSTLRRHVVGSHFSVVGRVSARPTRKSRRKWNRGYCCDICGRGYEMQRQMLAHRDVYHSDALPMRWSAFQSSKGKLRMCSSCSGYYRAGRFSDEHLCDATEETVKKDERMEELLRAKPCFRCDVCSVSFLWKLIFRQHREVSHPNAEPLNWDAVSAVEIQCHCSTCFMTFDQETDLVSHVCVVTELEAKPKSHECDICGGTYQRKSDFRRHRRFKHSIVEDGSNSGASIAAGESSELERRKPIINCPYCEMTTVTRNQILVHIKEVHDIDTDSPFVCVSCNKVFKRKATLDTHNQIYHPKGENAAENERILRENEILLNGEPAFHCNICNRNMFNAVRFLAHHRLHFVERKFTCDLCGKQTRTQHQLNTHIKIIHLNIRNHECDICRKSFHSRQSCEEHRRIHTGERPFSCEICGKTFVAMNALFTHKKFHDDFFPHPCSMCPKKFKVRRSLINHIRTHTGERPFQCELCSKTFNNSSRFSYHKKVTHSDNRPHRCTLCGSCFKANKFLMRHMKLHKIRTHIQFRRRNNPDYFAAHEPNNGAGAASDDSGGGVAKKTSQSRVKKELKSSSELASLLQPQIEFKIDERGMLLSGPATISAFDNASAVSAVADDPKSFDVDVATHFRVNDHPLANLNGDFTASAVASAATAPPTSRFPLSSLVIEGGDSSAQSGGDGDGGGRGHISCL